MLCVRSRNDRAIDYWFGHWSMPDRFMNAKVHKLPRIGAGDERRRISSVIWDER